MNELLKALRDLLTKFGGTFAIYIPFIISALTATFTYLQSINQKFDENFRNIVREVSSQDPNVCLPAVIKMGTFITTVPLRILIFS